MCLKVTSLVLLRLPGSQLYLETIPSFIPFGLNTYLQQMFIQIKIFQERLKLSTSSYSHVLLVDG